jgi:hypothetical protein
MTGTQPFQSPNRRRSAADRRQHEDRRAHTRASQEQSVDENQILRELLREAHARIRALEKAIAKLTSAI